MGTHQSGTGSLVFGRSSVLPSLQVLMFRGSVCELKWNFQFVDIPHFRVQILFQSGNEHLNSLREERVLRKVKPVKVKHQLSEESGLTSGIGYMWNRRKNFLRTVSSIIFLKQERIIT